jgi:hypothetical protein
MVMEVAALIAAIQGTTELLKQVGSVAQTIKSGLGSNNETAKREIDEKLAQLRENFGHVATLAAMAERYVRTHEDLTEILGTSLRAQRMIADDLDAFSDSKNARYAGNWRVLDSVFSEIDGARRPIQEAMNNRIQWFSDSDRNQVQPLLAEFEAGYAAASQAVRLHASSDARNGIDRMVRPLQTAETLVRETLFEILAALDAVGTGRT